MALPILDGNQTAATLSTIVTGGQHIPAHTVVSLGSQAITDMRGAVSGSVVSISNFPSTQTIAGTVTANLFGYDQANDQQAKIQITEDGYLAVALQVNNLGNIPISGTVTANGGDFAKAPQAETVGPEKAIRLGFADDESWNAVGLASGGSPLPTQLFDNAGNNAALTLIGGNGYLNVAIGNSVTISSLPSGALTTRFGSVTTASVAQLTSCVTNSSRKYLLAQNISAGTVTIGIGFSPTTTQGIQLTAGGGLTFDAFCPTGAVYWLGAVTGAAFTILEG